MPNNSQKLIDQSQTINTINSSAYQLIQIISIKLVTDSDR